jgi:hypothetical protein
MDVYNEPTKRLTRRVSGFRLYLTDPTGECPAVLCKFFRDLLPKNDLKRMKST